MTIELKPCPFCGSPAKESYDEKCDEWWIICTNDNCDIAPQAAMRDLRDAAFSWNQRIPEPPNAELTGRPLARDGPGSAKG